jgi:hypothetical protein
MEIVKFDHLERPHFNHGVTKKVEKLQHQLKVFFLINISGKKSLNN